MNRSYILFFILFGFVNITAQSANVDKEKLLEYYETQRYAEAAQYLKNIYPEDTKDIKALTQMAYCNMMSGKLQEAEKNYLKVNAIQPNSLPVLFSLAGINSRRGNVVKTKGYLLQIIQVDSINFMAYKQLAGVEDHADTKLKYLKKANALNATDPDAAYDLALFFRGLRQYQNAYDVLKTAITADPENFTLQQVQLSVANLLGKYEEVIEVGEKLMKNKTDVNVISDLGQAYFYVKDYQNCIKMYTILEDLDFQSESTLYFKALSYRELKDYNNALIYTQKTIEEGISKHTALYYAALAGIYETKDQSNDALIAYKRGLTFNGANIIYYRLALLYDLNLKQPKNALTYYMMYLKNKPNEEKEKEQIDYAKARIGALAKAK